MVERYSMIGRDFGARMDVSSNGTWVRYSDLAKALAENERLQTIIDNLHTVEEKHRETANAEFHRANRLQVDNERLTKERDEARAAETEYRRKSHKLTDDRDNPLAGI